MWNETSSNTQACLPVSVGPIADTLKVLEIGTSNYERPRHLSQAAVRLVPIHREQEKHLVCRALAGLPEAHDAIADFLHGDPSVLLDSSLHVRHEVGLDAHDAGLMRVS